MPASVLDVTMVTARLSELLSRLQQTRLNFIRLIMLCLFCCWQCVCVCVCMYSRPGAKQYAPDMHVLCLHMHTHPHSCSHRCLWQHCKLLLCYVLSARCNAHTQGWVDTYASPVQTGIPPWCAGWHSCVHVGSPSSSSSDIPPLTACSQSDSSSVNTITEDGTQ